MQFTKIKDALEYVGGFSAPSKMPCPSYSIPATSCKVGARLRKVKGSVCEKCYACSGMYRFPCVKNALQKRLESISKIGWVDAMVFAITKKKLSYMRINDSGDLQNMEHLQKIVEVAKRCPSCKFWLPTKENSLIIEFLKTEKPPENLTIRLSCVMINKENAGVKSLAENLGLCVSSVSSDMKKVNCHAYKTDGKCGDCRDCWNNGVFEVCYKLH